MSDSSANSARMSANEANDYAVSRVPKDKRQSLFSISTVLIGFCISMAGLYAGATLTNGLNLQQAIGAAIIGNVILTIYSGLMGTVGAREGMSTSMLMRRAFGRYGADAVSIIIALTELGWYAYQCGFFGATIHTMFPNAGFITHPVVAGIWGGACMMLTAYKGYKGLAILSAIAAPAIFIIALVGIFVAVNGLGGFSVLARMSISTGNVTFGSAIVLVVGAFAVGGVIQPDVTRYSKNEAQCMTATAIGYLIAHSFVIISGYVMCVTAGVSDVAIALLSVLGLPSLIVLILAQWTTNDNNLYSASLAANNMFPKFKKKRLVLIMGICATILGSFGLVNYFVSWLSILGTFIPPLAGIVIADYYFIKKRKYTFGASEGTKLGGINMASIIAWTIAAVVGLTVKSGVGCINTLVTAFVVYLVFETVFVKTRGNGFIAGVYAEQDDGSMIRDK